MGASLPILQSVKGNVGHTEPAAGLAGLLGLVRVLEQRASAVNAQLRDVNRLLVPSVRGLKGHLPTQSLRVAIEDKSAAAASIRRAATGVSSFGYSGTIAHAVVVRADGGCEVPSPSTSLMYSRRAFAWCPSSSHPMAQSRLPLSDGANVFRSTVAGALHALVADHVVQGRVIFPGAGYLEMARAAAEGESALCGVFFVRPLAIVVGGLVVECEVRDAGHFEVRSVEDESSAVSQKAAVHCTGTLHPVNAPWPRYTHALARACSCASAADVILLYDGFAAAGLQYGPGYRTLVQAWGGASAMAMARLRARADQQGTQVHPADLDDAFCLGMDLVSVGGAIDETRLPFAVDLAVLQGALGEPWAVRCSCLRACFCMYAPFFPLH